MIKQIDPLPAFHKISQTLQCLEIVFITSRRTYLPSINTLACSKAEIEPVRENMNLSYLAQNYSSITRLKQFVYRWQMYCTTESLPNMIQS